MSQCRRCKTTSTFDKCDHRLFRPNRWWVVKIEPIPSTALLPFPRFVLGAVISVAVALAGRHPEDGDRPRARAVCAREPDRDGDARGGQPAGGHPLQGEPPRPHWPPPCPPDLTRRPACRWSPSPRWAAPPPLTPALPPWPHKAASLPVVTLSKVSRPAPTDPRPAPLTSQGGQPAGGHPLQGEPPRPHWPPPCPPDLTRRPACRWSPSPRWAAPPPLTPALPPWPHKAASLPVVTLSKVSRPAPTDPRPAPLTSQGGQPAGGHPLQGEPPRPHWPPPCPPDLTRRPACRWSPSPRWAAPPPLTPALPPWPHKAASLPVVTLSKVSRPAPTDPRPAPLTSQGGQPAGGHPLQGEPPRPHWPPPCPPDLTRRPACRWSPSPRWAAPPPLTPALPPWPHKAASLPVVALSKVSRPAPTDPRPAPLTSQGGQPAGGRPLEGEPPRPHWPPALPPWPHKAASLPVVALSKVSRPAPTDPRPAPLTSQGGQPAGGHPLQGEPPRPHWPPPCPPDLTRRPACRWSPSPRWAAPPPLTPALPPWPHKAASLPVVTLSKVSRPAPTDPRPAPLTSQGGQPAGGHPLQGEPPRPHWPPPCPPDLTRRPACRRSPSPRWAAPPPLTPALPPWPHKAASLPAVTLSKVSRPAPTDPRPAPLTSQGGQPAGGHPLQGEPPRPHWPPPCPPDLTRRPACRWSPSPRWAAPPPLTPALPPWPHKAASLPAVTLSKVSRPAPTDPRPAPLTSQGGQPAGGHPLQGEPPRPHWPPPCPPDLTRRPACRWSPSPRWAAPPPLTPALPPWPHKAASLPVVALSKVSPPRPHWPPPCPPDLTRRPACRWSPSPRWACPALTDPRPAPWPHEAASLPVVTLSKVSRPAPTDPRPAPQTSQGGQPAGGRPLQGEPDPPPLTPALPPWPHEAASLPVVALSKVSPTRPHWPPPCPPDLARQPACRWSPSPRWARPAPTDPRPAPLTSRGSQPAGGRPLQGEPDPPPLTPALPPWPCEAASLPVVALSKVSLPRPHWPPPCPPDLTRRPACRWSPSPRWAAPPPLTPALPPWPHKAASLPMVTLSKVSRPAPTDPRPAPLTSQGGQPAGGHPLQGEPPRPHWPPPCPPDLTRRPACRWSPSPRWAAPPPLTPALPPWPHKAASLPVVTLSKVSRPAPTDPRPAPLTSQGGQPADGHPLQGEPPRPHWPPPCPPDLTRRPACRWSPSPRWAAPPPLTPALPPWPHKAASLPVVTLSKVSRPAPTDPRPAPLTSQGGQPADGHPLQGEPPRPHWPPPCPPDLTRRPACRWSPSPRWAAPPPLTPALPPWPHKAASLPMVTLSKVSRPAPTDPRPAPLTSQGGQPAGGRPLQGEPPRPHWPPPCPPDLTRRPACRWSPSPRWAAPPPLTPALPPWPHKAASLPVVTLSKVSRPAPTDPRPAPLTSQGGQPAGGHPLQGEPAPPPLTPALPPWPHKAASLPVVALSKVSLPRPHWPPPCPPDLARWPACRWSPSPRWARPAPTDPRHLLKGVILVTMSAALHLLYGTI